MPFEIRIIYNCLYVSIYLIFVNTRDSIKIAAIDEEILGEEFAEICLSTRTTT